jgi:hypothetical protein
MISKLQFSIQKYKNVSQLYIFSIFGHQNPGFGTGSGSAMRKKAGSRSALNQFGSTTLSNCTETGSFLSCWIMKGM